MIVATAGHIDHGKTSLIKALTGIDADRLPEEKRRGITVDLGFAYKRAASGLSLGFVDVPGHEKLVRTMLAGATGVDFVILVIAADDGVMPQTREHLAILDLLGLSRGIVAVTKSDRVDDGRLRATIGEARALIRGSGLNEAIVLPVSAHRGDGLDALADRLEEAAAAIERREDGGRFRLAIDRAFTMAGSGLVVTGTVHAGSVGPGDRLHLSPLGREVRVRGLRVQNEAAERGSAGQRCALNITGPRTEKADIQRGAWIVAPEIAIPTSRADVRLRMLPSETKALRHWTPVHIHIGSADISGRIALLEGAVLQPGESALGQIVLDAPTCAHYGDRFVVRDQSAQRTIGGGVVIDSRPPLRNARKPERLAFLRAFDQVDERSALAALIEAAPNGVDLDHFALVRNLEPSRLEPLLTTPDVVEVALPTSRLLFARSRWMDLRGEVVAALEAYQSDNRESFGATQVEILRTSAPMRRAAMAAALDAMIAEKAVLRFGQLIHLPGYCVELSLEEENLRHEIAQALGQCGLDPPRLSTIAEMLRLTEGEIKPLLEKLSRMGELTRVSKAYFLLPEIVARLAHEVRDCVRARPEAIVTVGQFREATGVSRHATMPILEFFDRIGFTRRHQDGRRVRVEHETIFTDVDGGAARARQPL